MLHQLPYDISKQIIKNVDEVSTKHTSSYSVLNLRLVSSQWNELILHDINKKISGLSEDHSKYIKSWKDYYEVYNLKKIIPLYDLDDQENNNNNNNNNNNFSDNRKNDSNETQNETTSDLCGKIERKFNVYWENMDDKIDVRLGIFIHDVNQLSRLEVMLHKLQISLNSEKLFFPESFSYFLLDKRKESSGQDHEPQVYVINLGKIKKQNEILLEIFPHTVKSDSVQNTSNDNMELLFLEFGESPKKTADEWLWFYFPATNIQSYFDHLDVTENATFEYKYVNRK